MAGGNLCLFYRKREGALFKIKISGSSAAFIGYYFRAAKLSFARPEQACRYGELLAFQLSDKINIDHINIGFNRESALDSQLVAVWFALLDLNFVNPQGIFDARHQFYGYGAFAVDYSFVGRHCCVIVADFDIHGKRTGKAGEVDFTC